MSNQKILGLAPGQLHEDFSFLLPIFILCIKVYNWKKLITSQVLWGRRILHFRSVTAIVKPLCVCFLALYAFFLFTQDPLGKRLFGQLNYSTDIWLPDTFVLSHIVPSYYLTYPIVLRYQWNDCSSVQTAVFIKRPINTTLLDSSRKDVNRLSPV